MYNNMYIKGVAMNVMSYTSLRQHLASAMEAVCRDHIPVIISRSGSDPAVLLSLEDYDSLRETAYLLEGHENRITLAKALEEFEEGRASSREVDL